MLVAAVWFLLERTQTGRRMRAVAADRYMARAVGIPVGRYMTLSLALAGALAGIAGFLLGHQFLVSPTQGGGHMLKAYIAVALGGWGSVPGAVLGALAIGVRGRAGEVDRRYLGLGHTLRRGPRGARSAAPRPVRRADGAARLMRRFWLVLLILPPVLALAVLPPFGQRLVTLIGLYALLGLGYQLVFGQLGALNLAQGAMFGVGAYATALAAPALGGFAFVVAILASAAVAAVIAGPILRLQSHYFALATLALASLVGLVAVNAESLTGGANGLVGFAATLPRGAALLCIVWLVLIIGVLIYAYLFNGPLGESARLLRQAPLAAATLGIDGGLWRFVAFVAGSALAGLAGAGSASLNGVVSPEVAGFSVMVLCSPRRGGGVRHPMGAVLGAAWLFVCRSCCAASREAGCWPTRPRHSPSYCGAARIGRPDRPAAGAAGPRAAATPRAGTGCTAPHPRSCDQALRRRRGARRRFVHSRARRDRWTDWPQWLGKSTLLNVVNGLERADNGTITLDSTHLERLPAHSVARRRRGAHVPDRGGRGNAFGGAGARAAHGSRRSCCSMSRRPVSVNTSVANWATCWAGCATRVTAS